MSNARIAEQDMSKDFAEIAHDVSDRRRAVATRRA